MEFVKYTPDMESEQQWLENEPTASLSGAAILVPRGAALSNEAIETIRHFRYYRDAREGIVLFSDTVAALVDAGGVDEMLQEAMKQANAVVGCMPDFAPLNMDDGCGLLHMTVAQVYGFRPYGIDDGTLGAALEVRQECLDACEEGKIVAVVYCDARDCE